MDCSLEGYFRRMDIGSLRVVCQMPDQEILPEAKELALEILAQREKEENLEKD